MKLVQDAEQSRVIAGYSAEPSTQFRFRGQRNQENFARIARCFGLQSKELVRMNQQHTDRLRVVSHANGGEWICYPGPDEPCDALISSSTDLMLCAITADCVPIILFDDKNGVIGIAHSGRAGTMLEIGYSTAIGMQSELGASAQDTHCILGPCLCAAHHEVQEKDILGFYERFSKDECAAFISSKADRYYVDMRAAITISLQRAGIPQSNISNVNICTYEQPELPSWRRDHDLESHLLSFVVLKSDAAAARASIDRRAIDDLCSGSATS